jgi:hypothetical protein
MVVVFAFWRGNGLSDNLVKDFNKFIYEMHTREIDDTFKFSYAEMAEWWLILLNQVIDGKSLPDGKIATALDIDKAKETIKRIEFEIDLFQANEGQE